jgi:hypothetical protein
MVQANPDGWQGIPRGGLVNGPEGLLGSSLALHVPVHLQKCSMSFSVIALKPTYLTYL